MKKRILSTLLALCLCLTLLPASAFAADSVPYLDADGASQTCTDCTLVESSSDDVTWSNGFYVVKGTATITGNVTVSGDVCLILCDNATLTVTGSIQLASNASLTICAQSPGNRMGKLTVNTGLIAQSGSLTVNGGDITAKEYESANETYGIVAKDLTVNEGSVTANGKSLNGRYSNYRSYGIYVSNSMTVTGGTVNATGGDITLNCEYGSEIFATSCGILVEEGDLSITGGSVTATGGTVSATATNSENSNGVSARSYGIYSTGNVTVETGASVTATAKSASASTSGSGYANSYSYGIYVEGADMQVKGGTVTGTSGDANTYSYGICVSQDLNRNGGDLTISGGSVSGTSGNAAKTGDIPSAGIQAITMTVSGAATTVTGKGGTISEKTDKYGIYVATLTVTEGILTAIDSQISASQGNISGGSFQGDTVLLASDFANSISGGSFTCLKGASVRGTPAPVAPLLADGYEFALSDGSIIVSGSGSTVTSVTNATVQKHEHNYATENLSSTKADDKYQCACGKTNAQKSVRYIDYVDGEAVSKYCSSYTEVTSGSTAWNEGWYVVKGTVAINDNVTVRNSVHLILCDGAKLTVNSLCSNDGTHSLTIYGQTNGTGELVATDPATGGSGNGIFMAYSLTINGGKVTATGGTNGICVSGALTVNGGEITATGGTNGIVCNDLTMTGGKLVAGCQPKTGTAVRESSGLRVNGWMTVSGGEVTATGGNATATTGSAYSRGIYCNGALTIGKATVTATGGTVSAPDYAYSYGIHSISMTVEDGAEITATGGSATATGDDATDAGDDATEIEYQAYSYGIYCAGALTIGKATVTATGGTASAPDYAESNGVYSGSMSVEDGAEITATGGTATASEYKAYSYGISCAGALTIGKATVTATGGAVSAPYTAYSYGICSYSTNTMTMGDGAKITATGGNATSAYRATFYGYAGSYGIYLYDTLTIGKADVTAASGSVLLLNQSAFYDTSNTSWRYSGGYDYAVYVKDLVLQSGGKLTATGGSVTYIDPDDATKTGKYVNAYSSGLYIYNSATISGTLTATGGSVNGHFGHYSVTVTSEGTDLEADLGGYANSYGAYCEGDFTVNTGAIITLMGGKATVNSTKDGYADSTGLYIWGGDVVMNGGAMYLCSDTFSGGDDSDANGLFVCDDNGSAPEGGSLIVHGGWLKIESKGNDVAVWAETGILLDSGVTIRTPAGGRVASEMFSKLWYTIHNAAGQAATTVLFWDGTTSAVSGDDYGDSSSGSSSGSGSSGSSSSNNTTITVPVSSDHDTVQVKAEVSKGNATVEVSDKQIESVIADHAGEVTVDVSGLKNVESATVPSHVVEKTNEAENTGLTVALPAGSVTLDETALSSVTEAADGEDVTVSVVSVPTTNLSPVVKDIIGMEPSVVAVVDVNITVGNSKQSSFDGGKVTISVPYIPKAGEDTSKLTVWFIKDDGTIENKGGYYDAEKKCFVFETNHLSQYLLVNTNKLPGFTDVPADAYYAAAVNWASTNGITTGMTETTFEPDLSCTRAQIVTFLWRAAGSPEPKAASGFTDVSADAYYAKAVAWAVENGITGGIGNNQFAPDLTCTRAQAVTFLFRYAAANGMETVTIQELVGGYSDAAQVPNYALPAFNWALAQGIVQGYNGNLMSNSDCTRAQIVTMLYRLLGE